MNKKITVFFGSPHKNGLTAKFTKKILGVYWGKANFIYFFKKNIKPCIDCGFCKLNKECNIKDDMESIYFHLENSDILIFSTPVYNFYFPAPVKLFLDRLQKYYFNNYDNKGIKKERKAYLLITSDRKNKNVFNIMNSQIKYLCKILNIKFIGNFWIYKLKL